MAKNDSSPWLTHQWIAAGIISAAARFIPLPFVDDLVRGQCRRFIVARTLSAYEKDALMEDIKPFYDNDRGWIAGTLSSVAKIPIKLLLFPVRKVASIVTSVRGVPLEIMRTVLLGRTLERYLEDDRLSGTAAQAAQMQVAFELAFSRMDFRVAKAAIGDALSSVLGWKNAAMKTAKRVMKSDDLSNETLKLEPEVDDGVGRVQAIFKRPETMRLFSEFDRRFDEAMDEAMSGTA